MEAHDKLAIRYLRFCLWKFFLNYCWNLCRNSNTCVFGVKKRKFSSWASTRRSNLCLWLDSQWNLNSEYIVDLIIYKVFTFSWFVYSMQRKLQQMKLYPAKSRHLYYSILAAIWLFGAKQEFQSPHQSFRIQWVVK